MGQEGEEDGHKVGITTNCCTGGEQLLFHKGLLCQLLFFPFQFVLSSQLVLLLPCFGSRPD